MSRCLCIHPSQFDLRSCLFYVWISPYVRTCMSMYKDVSRVSDSFCWIVCGCVRVTPHQPHSHTHITFSAPLPVHFTNTHAHERSLREVICCFCEIFVYGSENRVLRHTGSQKVPTGSSTITTPSQCNGYIFDMHYIQYYWLFCVMITQKHKKIKILKIIFF